MFQIRGDRLVRRGEAKVNTWFSLLSYVRDDIRTQERDLGYQRAFALLSPVFTRARRHGVHIHMGVFLSAMTRDLLS